MSQPSERLIHSILVKGVDVGPRTECAHYQSDLDIVAIKFRCCNTYFPCRECHDAAADHPAQLWPKSSFGKKAVLCGVCGHELTIREYMGCEFHCPVCTAPFNPGCANHYGLYFE